MDILWALKSVQIGIIENNFRKIQCLSWIKCQSFPEKTISKQYSRFQVWNYNNKMEKLEEGYLEESCRS